MADTRRKTILLQGEGNFKEAKSTAATILPGSLLERTSGGIRKHATAGGNAQRLFAFENEGNGGTIDTVYPVSSLIKILFPEPGDEVLAILKNGEHVVVGDYLESAGGGELQKHVADVDLNHPGSADFTVYTNQIIGVALEECNMSGSNAVDPSGRFAIEIV